jgi:hypothetical protein
MSSLQAELQKATPHAQFVDVVSRRVLLGLLDKG